MKNTRSLERSHAIRKIARPKKKQWSRRRFNISIGTRKTRKIRRTNKIRRIKKTKIVILPTTLIAKKARVRVKINVISTPVSPKAKNTKARAKVRKTKKNHIDYRNPKSRKSNIFP